MSTLHRGHFIDASYQVSVQLAMRFQRRRYLKIGQSETRVACGGHVGKSSLKSTHFVMIHYQTWPPQATLVSDWPIFKYLLL
jgi:hypothetical protein